MKVSVSYKEVSRRRVGPLRNQNLLYHAIVVPLRKGIWWFSVDFKVRTDIFCYATGDKQWVEEIYLPINEKETRFAVVKFDYTKEKRDMDIYGHVSKTTYTGIIMEASIVSRAFERWNNDGRKKHVR